MELDRVQGSFDLALRNAVWPESNLHARKLAEDKRILCASPEYLATHGTPESPDDLLNHQLIAFKSASSIKLTGPDGKSGEFNTRVAGHRLTIDDGLSYKIATRCGTGIAIHSLWSVHQELAGGSLIQVRPEKTKDDKHR